MRIAFLYCWLLPIGAPEAPNLTPAEEARREAQSRYALGLWQARLDRLTEAAKQFRIATEQDPKAAAPHKELARVYSELGRDSSAMREGRAALALDPNDSATALLLGKLLVEGNQFGEAAKVYRLSAESTELDKQPWKQLTALQGWANAAEKANDSAGAETALTKALALAVKSRVSLVSSGVYTVQELDRLRADLSERLGEGQLKLKKNDAAIAAFQSARDLCADKAGANRPAGVIRLHLHLAKVHMANGDSLGAMKELDKYLAFAPSNLEAYELYVLFLRRSGREREILPALERFSQRNQKNTGIVWLLEAENLRAGSRTSTDTFRQLATSGGDADGFRILVRAYIDAKKSKELLALADVLAKATQGREEEDETTAPKGKGTHVKAVERLRHFTAAVKAERGITPDLVQQYSADITVAATPAHAPSTLELLMYLAERDGQLDAFGRALKASLRTTTAKKETNTLLFSILSKQRKWRELATICEDAIRRRDLGNSLSPYYEAAIAYAELGDEVKSLEKADYSVNNVTGEGSINVRLNKIYVLNLLGQHRVALKLCDELLTEPIGADEVRRTKVQMAEAYHRLRDYKQAEAILRDQLADDPDNVLVLNNLGYNLADQGRKLDEAEAMIRRAIELDKDDRLRVRGSSEAESGTYLDSLGWVLFRKGEFKTAAELLEKACKLNDTSADGVVWDHLGDVYYRLNRKTEAKKAWLKAVELYKDSHHGRIDDRMADAKKKSDLPE